MQSPISNDGFAGVETVIMHSSGEWISGEFMLKCSKNDPQGMGSAITYAKRYALKALGLMPDLDDDAEAAMFRQVEQFTDAQKDEFYGLIAQDDGFGLKRFHAVAGEDGMNALFNGGERGQKRAGKNKVRAAVSRANQSMKATVDHLEEQVASGEAGDAVDETIAELNSMEKEFVIAAMDDVLKRQIEDMTGVEL